MSHAHETHREKAPKKLGFYVITVSTSRYQKLSRREPVVDESGDKIKEIIISNGHDLKGYNLVPDDKIRILKAVIDALLTEGVDVIVTTGGTGYTPSDLTVETIRGVLDREVEGFRDVFRGLSLSDPKVGPAAYLSKASAGIIAGKLIYMLPGSPDAVKLGMEKLIIPEAPHLVYLARSI
ncbi:MogA/MoaB family molybdenum cofactor biosynthesis protein [Metallosphaera hakonensis]|uniref:Molybdenum cofactor biosynthesis protein n=1 Tax=Metallosphaera hakonensis JCM 8857 = DSM 7519 TaxID=1293036 RepID=A0A2U9IWV5_9CREN|nr:molybdenum cofactor biosynthesis protein B [Metallosphaera hakonensis]AWS00559.1 molybdenum cofactor biosynthesis protein [Metallosphaera hakonensis JCM 8857 = DSM 7519]